MIYVLGERPGPNTDPSSPLDPDDSMSGKRLAALLGMSSDEYRAGTTRMNAVEEGKTPTTRTHVRERVSRYYNRSGMHPFLVMGISANRAMPVKFRNMKIGDVVDNVLLLPHTSGICRIWNDKEYMAALQAFAREFINIQEE